jgi:hypothetical protein
MVMALWVVGKLSRSADSGTCRLLLPMLQFRPSFAVDTPLTLLLRAYQVILQATLCAFGVPW